MSLSGMVSKGEEAKKPIGSSSQNKSMMEHDNGAPDPAYIW